MRKYLVPSFVSLALLTGVFLISLNLNVYAAPIAKLPEAGCETVGIVGAVIISHCVDKSGFEFEANSAGFMIPSDK